MAPRIAFSFLATVMVLAVLPADAGAQVILPSPFQPRELIRNGGFEEGFFLGTIAPWERSGLVAYGETAPNGCHAGHLSRCSVALAAVSGTQSAMSQTIQLRTARSTSLSFWIRQTPLNPAGGAGHDRLAVEVRTASGALLGTLSIDTDAALTGQWVRRGDFELERFACAGVVGYCAGQSVQVRFVASAAAGGRQTLFYVDDVSAVTF
jgi:hypothetical protein